MKKTMQLSKLTNGKLIISTKSFFSHNEPIV